MIDPIREPVKNKCNPLCTYAPRFLMFTNVPGCVPKHYCVTMRPAYCCVPMRLVVYPNTPLCNYAPRFLLCTNAPGCVPKHSIV